MLEIGTIKKEQQNPRNFTVFKKSLEDMASISINNQNYWNKRKTINTERKSSEEIDRSLFDNNESELRVLSRTYWNVSGLYRRLIVYMATMLTYDTLVVPKINAKAKSIDKDKVISTLTDACYFVDNLNIEQEFARIFTLMLIDGVYYGFFKECENGKVIFQDLDPYYCRTRFKSSNGLPVLEFDLTYFIQLEGLKVTTNVDLLGLYPAFVRKAYNKYFKKVTKTDSKGGFYIEKKANLEEGRWLIIPDSLGIVFYYQDTKPFFAAVIKSIEDLNEYKGLEKSLDKQELKKILMQKIPTDSNGELLFTLEEAAEIHKAAVKMLRNNPDVDVFTTLTDTQMLELQDSKQANRDNLEKIERSVYNEAGVSKNLFASDGTTALDYSQKVDMALVYDIAQLFATFLTYQVNRKFVEKKFFLEVSILPITHYNREKMFELYLKGAQYGYSKIMAGVAAGMKQSNLLNLITLENEYLDLASKMVPLQSSHTTSGKEIAQEGGAPAKEGMQKSDKTRQNEESK